MPAARAAPVGEADAHPAELPAEALPDPAYLANPCWRRGGERVWCRAAHSRSSERSCGRGRIPLERARGQRHRGRVQAAFLSRRMRQPGGHSTPPCRWSWRIAWRSSPALTRGRSSTCRSSRSAAGRWWYWRSPGCIAFGVSGGCGAGFAACALKASFRARQARAGLAAAGRGGRARAAGRVPVDTPANVGPAADTAHRPR